MSNVDQNKGDEKQIKYRNQIVAFIDILGFSDMIKDAQEDNDKAYTTIMKITNAIEQAVEKNLDCRLLPKDKPQPTDPVYRVFSDCICISSDCIEEMNSEFIDHFLFYFLMNLLYVQAELTLHGIFIRGGVTINKHFYNDKIIFSSALVDAYKLESKKSIYPRILIHNSIIDMLRNLSHEDDMKLLNAVIKRDADGLVFLDYLEYISEVDDLYSMYEFMVRHKATIEKNILGPLEPEVKQKYLWLARYHNQKVKEQFPRADRKPLLISDKLIQYNANVFRIEWIVFPFISAVENISNGFLFIKADERWKAEAKAKEYIKTNKKDYQLNSEYLRAFGGFSSGKQLALKFVEADSTIDKTIVLR